MRDSSAAQLLDWITGAGGFLVGLVGAVLTVGLSRHELRKTGLELLRELTTGEVADARNVVGAFMYGDNAQLRALDRAELIRSYYVLLWAIERNAEGYAALASRRSITRRGIAKRFRKSVRWHTTEITTNLALIHEVVPGIDDTAAWNRVGSAAAAISAPLPTPEEIQRTAVQRNLATRLARLGGLSPR